MKPLGAKNLFLANSHGRIPISLTDMVRTSWELFQPDTYFGSHVTDGGKKNNYFSTGGPRRTFLSFGGQNNGFLITVRTRMQLRICTVVGFNKNCRSRHIPEQYLVAVRHKPE